MTHHWLLFPDSPLPGNLPIGCTRGPTTAEGAVRAALPEKEWASHHAKPAGTVCPVCATFDRGEATDER